MLPRPKVLIVDDDVNVIAALQPLLSAECTLRATRQGADVLRLARADPPDLVLLDVEMPDLSGYEVCRQLKDDAQLADVPVVFLTRHHEEEAELRGLAAGAVDFIPKPPRGPVVLARILNHVRLKRLGDALRVEAWIDGLTGIANRRRWDELLRQEANRALRQRSALSVLMIDVDHFKAYNDHHGHGAGDGCLRDVALALARCMRRPSDLVARYGGEEFAMLLPATDRDGARVVAERVLREVADLQRPHGASSAGPHVSVSVGCASFDAHSPGWLRDGADPQHADQLATTALESLLRAADAALYQAKHQGRARAVAAPDGACQGHCDAAGAGGA